MKLPSNWDEISVETFANLYPLILQKAETPKEKLDLNYKRIITVMDCEIEDVDRLTVKEVADFNNFIISDMPSKLYKRFKLNGVKYEFDLDANNLKAGTYTSIMTDIQQEPYKVLYKILFNIAKPIKLTPFGYKSYEFDKTELHKRMEDFKQMPISIANPIAVFFCKLSNGLTEVMDNYLNKQMEGMMEKLNQVKEDLQDTDG